MIALHRPGREPPFSERERSIVDLFHRESRALSLTPERDLEGDLSPQLRKTLLALQRGLSEKQAATELGLSAHTVHDYIKDLYRRFGVTSRSELFARLGGWR